MKIFSMALTRPRIALGVPNWTSVDLMTTLTMSKPPVAAKAISEAITLCETPKTMVATPKPATHHNSSGPAFRDSG